MPLEKDIEAEVNEAARELNLLQVKLDLKTRKGWPDRQYLYRGRVLFIEYKRPGQKTEPIQAFVHVILREAGFLVYVVDNADYGITILKEWKRSVDLELA
jgi:hypothetical protein